MGTETVTRLRTDDRRLYTRAIDVLRALINSGPYKPGDRLPTEGELSAQFGISRTTLRVALGTLESQGLIYRRQGAGTFVSPQTSQVLRGGLQFLTTVQSLALEAGLQPETSERVLTMLPATAAWAEVLAVAEGSALNRVAYTVAIKGLPVASIDTLVPESVVSRSVLASTQGSLLEFYLDHKNLNLAYTHSQVCAVEADDVIARTLQVPVGKALLYLVETYFDGSSSPLALSHNHFVTDRFGYYVARVVKP